jgi:hypothetical protein
MQFSAEQIIQVVTLLVGCFGGFFSCLTGLGGVAVAIFTIFYQGQREAGRDKRLRVWTTEDRDVNRAWQLSDIGHARSKDYLQIHQRFVEDYMTSLRRFANDGYNGYIQSGSVDDNQIKDVSDALLNGATEAMHHLEIFQKPEIVTDFEDLLKLLTMTIQQAEIDRRSGAPSGHLRKISALTAKISRQVDIAIAEEITKENQKRN